MSDTESGYMSVDGRRVNDSVRVVCAEQPEATHDNVILDEFSTLEEVREAIRKQGLETCNLIFVTMYEQIDAGYALGSSDIDLERQVDHNLEQKFKRLDVSTPEMYSSYGDIRKALKQQGLETCSLIFGIDYTMSNKSQGQKTFEGRNLHSISDTFLNPYQRVICILGETLEPFDEDGIIPVYGFGDFKCKDKAIFELKEGEQCEGFSDVLDAYNEITPKIKLGGPTNFAPLIYKAIEIVKETNEYHILVIVADGQVSSENPTKTALIEASHYPLSIVVVGVGDGPWGAMKTFDDGLTDRQFDNFQFVNFHEVMKDAENPEAAFALHALMEIPEQYRYLKQQCLVH